MLVDSQALLNRYRRLDRKAQVLFEMDFAPFAFDGFRQWENPVGKPFQASIKQNEASSVSARKGASKRSSEGRLSSISRLPLRRDGEFVGAQVSRRRLVAVTRVFVRDLGQNVWIETRLLLIVRVVDKETRSGDDGKLGLGGQYGVQ